MNKVKIAATVVAICLLTMSSADAQGASSLYVSTTGNDSNPGTLAQPFRTIKRGLRALRAGDVLYIRGGAYTEHLVENDFAVSGSSSAWITVTAYSGESVTIRNAGAGEIIRFQDGSRHHIEFRNVTLDGSSHNDGHGIVMIGYPGCCGDGTITHDLKFSDVEIRDTWGNGIIGGGSNHQFINLRVYRSGRIPPEVYVQGANAVYFTGDNSVFEGGDYSDNLCWGIRVDDSNVGHRATGNVISRVRVHSNGVGKGLGGTSRCGSSGGGIVVGDTNNIVMNSLIYNNNTGVDIMGLSGKSVQGIKIYNNTIHGNVGHGIGVGIFASATGTDIKNNILSQNGSAITEFSALSTDQAYNVTSDPGFVDAPRGDFTLRFNSAAIDAGTFLQSVVNDFGGASRPRGRGFDLGAFEFGEAAAAAAGPAAPATALPPPPQNVRIVR